MRRLTDRQRELLVVIVRFRRRFGMYPTLRELQAQLRVNYTTVRQHFKACARKGLIVIAPGNKSRAYVLANDCALLAPGTELGWRCKHCDARNFGTQCGNPACPIKGTNYATSGPAPLVMRYSYPAGGGRPAWCLESTGEAARALSALEAS